MSQFIDVAFHTVRTERVSSVSANASSSYCYWMLCCFLIHVYPVIFLMPLLIVLFLFSFAKVFHSRVDIPPTNHEIVRFVFLQWHFMVQIFSGFLEKCV